MGDSYTIQISSNLVNKLVGDGNKQKKKVKKTKTKTKIPHEHHKHQNEQIPAPAAPVWPVQPPVILPVGPPPASLPLGELGAIRSVLHESEGLMKKLEKQEDNLAQELTRKAKELHEREFKLPYQRSIPCLAEREACRECYKEQQQSKQPLKCAQVVRSYEDCVRQARQAASS